MHSHSSFVVSSLLGDGNFSLLHYIWTGSGAHPASYAMGTRSSFPGSKVARARS